MANVRCPMCSNLNPPEALLCAFCGARLKPVQPPSHTPEEPQDDASDWLSSLRLGDETGNSAEKSSASEQEAVPESEMPDWLSRIRERAKSETFDGPESAGADDETPDWMKDLRAGADEPVSEESGGDWLDRLPGGAALPVSEPAEDNEPRLEDWLQSFPVQPSPKSAPEENEEWINKLSDWQASSAETPRVEPPASEEMPVSSSFGLTGWLASLDDQVEKPAQAEDVQGWSVSEQPPSPTAVEENRLPDWLGGGEQTPPSQSEEELVSDWLRDVPSQPSVEPAQQSAPVELPDWLSGGDQTIQAQSEEKLVSDWLRDVPIRSSAEPQPAPADLPDWLNAAGSDFSAGVQSNSLPEPSETSKPAGEENLPDWFSHFGESETQAETPAEEPEFTKPDESAFLQPDNLPDWLGGEPQSPLVFGEEIPAAEQRGDFAWPAPANNFLQEKPPAAAGGEGSAPAQPAAAQPFYDEETPDWLRDFSAQAPSADSVPPLISIDDIAGRTAADEVDQTFAGAELPDWLSEEALPVAAEAEAEKAGEPAGEELARAELPQWVKEMRPIEAVVPGESITAETSQQVEKAGPLAGLRGVLPVEEMTSRYRKPPVYSAKLRVSEKQRNQSSLLDSIVAQESQPLLIAPERSRAPRVIARVVVALLFLVTLAVARIFPIGLQPAPMLTPPELRDMFEQIDQRLQQGAPVLMAVDFEPGRSGEMYFAASPVVEHLMARNAQIVVLSTVPTGPALAQQLLSNSARDLQQGGQQPYDLNTQTINLGYLPGGTISLLEFAQIPSRAAPASLEGNYEVWDRSFLKSVQDMGGFSQVIVLTDSAETGRAWVEQVQPLMGATPLFMVTSSQAAPLLMPYVQSQQINGMVSGLLGGVIYGQWRQADTPAGVYWESYQVGILLATAVILIGGLISASSAIFKRKEKDEA